MKTNVNLDKCSDKQLLQLALMCSYAYYQCFHSLIPDEQFDLIMERLLDNWDNFEHQHKYLLTKEDLKAGTGFKIKREDYPTMVIQAAEIWIKEKSMQDNFEGK